MGGIRRRVDTTDHITEKVVSMRANSWHRDNSALLVAGETKYSGALFEKLDEPGNSK